MTAVEAVLFDLGGTLYDYRILAAAERECLIELARWMGVQADAEEIMLAQRLAMKEVFRQYVPRRYYLHRDLFRDAVEGMLRHFGAVPDKDQLERYERLQWERYRRDFALREGAVETLLALRDRVRHLGIVSNIDRDQLCRMATLGRLDRYFDSMLSSEEAGSCKPDEGIFSQALKRAGCKPEQALFVGDAIAQDIAGANRAGVRSVLLWYREDRDPPDGPPHATHLIRRLPELLELVG